jgi:hypothetical protein
VSALALPGFLAFFVVALVVGLRLLALAARTRQLPELLMGVGVLGIGPVGFGGIVLALGLAHDAPGASRFVAGAASCAVGAGVAAKYLFNWRIYRPTSPVAAAASLAGIAGITGALVAEGLSTGFATEAWRGAGWHLARSSLQVGCLLWGAGEALAYWTRMRRRVRLGIADPLLANRFLLWAIGAGAAGLGSAIGTGVQLVTGRPPLEQSWLTMSSSLHGLVSAVALWLAFVPPAAYRRWVRAGQPAS